MTEGSDNMVDDTVGGDLVARSATHAKEIVAHVALADAAVAELKALIGDIEKNGATADKAVRVARLTSALRMARGGSGMSTAGVDLKLSA
jgi:hypothetical protein